MSLSFHRIAFSILTAIFGLTLGGCQFFRPEYSPLPAFSPKPDQLGAILPELQKRWSPITTYKASDELEISRGLLGTRAFPSAVVYESPDRFRLGLTRGPSTVLEVLQVGDQVGIMLPTDRIVFVGAVEELKQHPGAIGGVEPLEIARALLIGETFMEAIRSEQQAGKNPAQRSFEDDKLVFGHDVAEPGQPVRHEQYVVRQKDGLIESARLETRVPGQPERVVDIEYDRWGISNGRPYPTRVVIRSSAAKMIADIDSAEANPGDMSERAFTVDPQRFTTVRPLQEFLQQTDNK